MQRVLLSHSKPDNKLHLLYVSYAWKYKNFFSFIQLELNGMNTVKYLRFQSKKRTNMASASSPADLSRPPSADFPAYLSRSSSTQEFDVVLETLDEYEQRKIFKPTMFSVQVDETFGRLCTETLSGRLSQLGHDKETFTVKWEKGRVGTQMITLIRPISVTPSPTATPSPASKMVSKGNESTE